jgi:hypothetical protein
MPLSLESGCIIHPPIAAPPATVARKPF